MIIVNQKAEIIDEIDESRIMKKLEAIGRVCYRSENQIKEGSDSKFIANIIKSGHESVIEHESITVRFITTRAIANQLVRHRLASFSQESTRYCNYTKDKFENSITCINPQLSKQQEDIWALGQLLAEEKYFHLINLGAKPEEARGVLTLDLKTELIMTANLREWRHIIKQRTSKAADPQIRKLVGDLAEQLIEKLPVIFSDLKQEEK